MRSPCRSDDSRESLLSVTERHLRPVNRFGHWVAGWSSDSEDEDGDIPPLEEELSDSSMPSLHSLSSQEAEDDIDMDDDDLDGEDEDEDEDEDVDEDDCEDDDEDDEDEDEDDEGSVDDPDRNSEFACS